MQVEKTIKANVEVLTIKPTEIDTFWPLVEFLIAEGRHKELTKEMKALRLIADTWVMPIKEYED